MSNAVNTASLLYLNEQKKAREQAALAEQNILTGDAIAQLPPLPENSNIRIYVDKEHERDHDAPRRRPKEFSMRAIWAWVAGIVSGGAAGFAASMHAQDKMLDFEAEVAGRTRSIV